ncbi:ATPase family associated with various cellular activities (AAA) [Prevotella sp. ne3005]|uniref:AAA family ATPase n=1 Tax=Prevotella sp. ne3005 TaxID=1761887 RepID=UPI0008ACAB3C|nr:AAA family ATPase [Prevotella sp. ne3005]SEN24123.1 ATPase family associated with various cellular activities (AAA) [Prevotella sp. ne3005]
MATTIKSRKKNQQKSVPTLLQAIEKVVELAEDSKMSEEFMLKAAPEICLLAESFGITERQAVLFCVCMEKGPRRVDYDDLASYLDLNKIGVLSYASDIDALVRRRLLKFRDVKDEDDFDIPSVVIRYLKHNEVYQLPQRKGLDCAAMFELLDQWFEDLDDDAISPRALCEELQQLFEDNPQVGFVKHLKEYYLSDEDEMMVAFFAHRLVNRDDDDIRFCDIEDLYDSRADFTNAKSELRIGEHKLQEKKLIEHKCVDGLADVTKYKLTDAAKRDLLAEMKINATEEKLADMLDASKLTEKKLFFPKDIERQVEELGSFLQPENYQKIQERMKEKGFRYGFACLFYGSPGTGKTETVYQLAKKTGRNIMVVDVPQLKSMWVGQSEKNVKALFDRYREQVSKAKLTPILLFNEADAIIGKRKNGAENAVDKMENSLQNIILQEMEQLDGIMIATTNLQQNMDKAFERRFLYKIKFEKPTEEARVSIWHSMIPDLSDLDVHTLASKYDFSGGQIENIARHYAIDTILHGQAEDVLPMLIRHCDNERLDETNVKKIGF